MAHPLPVARWTPVADGVDLLEPAPRPLKLRLYRTAADGERVTFTAGVDRQIPLVDCVTVLCASRDQVAEVVHTATEVGLAAAMRRPSASERWNGARFAVKVQDRTQEAVKMLTGLLNHRVWWSMSHTDVGTVRALAYDAGVRDFMACVEAFDGSLHTIEASRLRTHEPPSDLSPNATATGPVPVHGASS